MDSERLINLFDIKKELSHLVTYYWAIFFNQFVNKFSELLCEINIFKIFNRTDCYRIFVITK